MNHSRMVISPRVDPNLTQVGRSVDRTQLNYADETIQGMTVPANALDKQQTMSRQLH